MSIIGLKEPYADVAYGKSILGVTKPWISSSSTQQEDALQYARIYIDDLYSCPDIDQTEDPPIDSPDYLKTANSLFANEHLTEDLFLTARNASPEKGLTEKTVEAKPVKSTKKYDTNRSNTWVDPFPSITALLLTNGCRLLKGSIRFVPLLRR